MKMIVAFLIIGSTAAAGQLYNSDGNLVGDGRSVADWSKLASSAKSIAAKLGYAKTLELIAQHPLPPADKAAIRDACLVILKDTKDEQRRDKPTAHVAAAGSEGRLEASLALVITGDESCLPALLARLNDEEATERECRAAEQAIAAIGGRKAVDGLAKLARSPAPADAAAARIYRQPIIGISFNYNAVDALGQIGTRDSEDAIRKLITHAEKTGNDVMAEKCRKSLAACIERRNAADDAKVAKAKPGK